MSTQNLGRLEEAEGAESPNQLAKPAKVQLADSPEHLKTC